MELVALAPVDLQVVRRGCRRAGQLESKRGACRLILDLASPGHETGGSGSTTEAAGPRGDLVSMGAHRGIGLFGPHHLLALRREGVGIASEPLVPEVRVACDSRGEVEKDGSAGSRLVGRIHVATSVRSLIHAAPAETQATIVARASRRSASPGRRTEQSARRTVVVDGRRAISTDVQAVIGSI